VKISIVGTGYVGLVTGACLAEKGHSVMCVDVEQDKVDQINDRRAPFYEADLDGLLEKNVPQTLQGTTNLEEAVVNSDLTLIAVGTPFDGEEIDLTFIRKASADIGKALAKKHDYHVVVVKSTVVPGTTEEVVLPILEQVSGKKAGMDFGVGMNPEFLREGEAVSDFMFPDRIVLGGIDQRTRDVLDDLYVGFSSVNRLRTNTKTAEMIKYASNSFLATAISFSNEIGNLCSALGGVDVVDVMQGVHLDKRLSPILPNGERIVPSIVSYLEAGCGFGGSCFPKDVMALRAHGTKAESPMRILQAVLDVNKEQPKKIFSLIEKHYPDLNGVCVAVLGLAFKPGTDDMRETPALPVVKWLLAKGATVQAYDPVVGDQAKKIFNHEKFSVVNQLRDVLEGDVRVVVVLTRWNECLTLPQVLSGREPQPVIIDGRRMLDKHSVSRYEGIGLSGV
jgi:UDPglucose 6-dehydrogenase